MGVGARVPAVSQVHARQGARVHDGHRAIPAEETRDLFVGSSGRRQPDALWVAVGDRRQSFQGHREMRAALGGRERVHLVDDHRVHGA